MSDPPDSIEHVKQLVPVDALSHILVTQNGRALLETTNDIIAEQSAFELEWWLTIVAGRVPRRDMDEADLIRASQSGDGCAFNRLVLIYQDIVFNLSYRMTEDRETAADITQEVFLAGFQGLKSFRGGSFKAWLLRIATNRCYDELRRRQRRPTRPLDDLLCDGEEDTALIAHDPGPEEQSLRRELLEYLQSALASLSPEQRATVVLCDVQGLSYEEIAVSTSSSLGTVKSRLSRARAHMREYLLHNPELLPPYWRHDYER